ncbi:MAG: 4-(cytidine 5'-diphospho)-2-C-methyl-D-erythritol kinase [Bacillota bacterium]|nr:4-(cytidine 5'-diphospho)-2-C-methyl-D-erythritol kinase [Bacillota bacterium]
MQVTVKAPAKINLVLQITGKLDNGYHTLSMIMQAVSLYDTVSVAACKEKGISVSCNHPNVPCNDKNIVYKAAVAFFESNSIMDYGIHINIDKQIPTEAGLAGGSTDGAAVLIALNTLYNTGLSLQELAEIGAKIGTDIPFCLFGGSMLIGGVGTELTKIQDMPDCQILIAKPNVSVSTKEAYSLSDAHGFSDNKETIRALQAFSDGNLREITNSMVNDFEKVMALKEVEKTRDIMNQNGALGSRMTGSGSAVFGIFEKDSDAHAALNILKTMYQDVFLCTPLKYGCKIITE